MGNVYGMHKIERTYTLFALERRREYVCIAHVANSILTLAGDDTRPITLMQLHKLLYFLYKDYLKSTGMRLFLERFRTTDVGPASSEVTRAYHKLKEHAFITSFFPDADGKERYIPTDGSDQAFTDSLLTVWMKYSKYAGDILSVLTHAKDSAWKKAWQRNKPFLSDTDIKEEPDFF